MSREYVLTIKNETNDQVAAEVGGAGGVNATQKSGGNGGGKTAMTADQAIGKVGKSVASLFSVNMLVSLGMQEVSFQVSQVYLRTGSREAQQRASYTYSIASRAFSSLRNIGTAAAHGAAVGCGYGAAAGAAIAILGEAMNWMSYGIEIQHNQSRIDTENRLETITRDMGTQRATVSGSRYQTATQG